ncbi:DNA-dependent helicase II [compost metagenome]
MASNKEVAELIAEARKRWPEIKPDNKKLQDELDFINDAMITSEEHYLEVDRAGQGFALRAAERVQLWELFEVVKQGLASKGKRLWSSLPRDIALAPQDGTLNLYRHILIDEAQFFAPSWFQVVKHSLEPQQGSLFLCADPNQGFMKSRLSWKRVGLDVAGKTKKLRRSYRTTQRILEAANQVLVEYTDADAEDFLTPDFEGMTPGQPPLLIISDSPQDAVSQLCNEIRDGSNQLAIPLSSMLVVYGPGVSERLLETRLGEALGTGRLWNLSTGLSTPQAADYLRLARLDTATGLEANSVFLIGLEPLLARGFENAAGATGKAKEIEESARKLYMAMTRAGQRLIVVNSQPIPATLARLFEQPCTVAAT